MRNEEILLRPIPSQNLKVVLKVSVNKKLSLDPVLQDFETANFIPKEYLHHRRSGRNEGVCQGVVLPQFCAPNLPFWDETHVTYHWMTTCAACISIVIIIFLCITINLSLLLLSRSHIPSCLRLPFTDTPHPSALPAESRMNRGKTRKSRENAYPLRCFNMRLLPYLPMYFMLYVLTVTRRQRIWRASGKKTSI